MDFRVVLLALFQGLSEFLPISSSGHILLLQNLLDFTDHAFFYNVVFHLGTFFAVVIFFRNDLKRLLKEAYQEIAYKKVGENLLLLIKIILAVIPTIILGFIFQEKLVFLFLGESFFFLGFCFLITGGYLFMSKFLKNGYLTLDNLSKRKSLAIGFMQALALLPGISRSGMTIVTALLLGIKREAAFIFSFFIGLPIFLGAFLLEAKNIYKNNEVFFSLQGEYPALLTAFLFSFISGWVALKILYRLTINNHLHWFSYYLLGLGVVLIVVSF